MALNPLVGRAALGFVLCSLASSGVAAAQVWEICSLRDTYLGDAAGDQFGWVGVNAGDVDGDGFGDYVFGAMGAAGGAGLGDVDGDGWNDFLLTAATSSANTGAAYVVRGGLDNPLETCAAAPNSLGLGARLEYRRSTSLAANEFRLRVADAIPGEPAVFFYGPQREVTPLGDGTLCVSGAQYRLATVSLNNQGSKFIDLDFTTGAPSGGKSEITPGSSWYFQVWYRDPGGVAGANLSNGLRVTFCQ